MSEFQSTADSLPEYLQPYLCKQNYDVYTPRQHATWRYIMRLLSKFCESNAVSIYTQGLELTGIPIDRIPHVHEIDHKLQKYGWGAVSVDGFVPSAVFLDLLSRGVMPIAREMRSVDHIGYTPAPDIIHEAAGHVPIVADESYRRFLKTYSNAAFKAILSDEDIRLYEAIRFLSDIKERHGAIDSEIENAEKALTSAVKSLTFTSESSKVSRMAWWTIEYGLVGPSDPKIYGAGLLSSVAESRSCLEDNVQKIPLSLECVDVSYDITEPQPQLYVAESLESLPLVLEDLENTLAFKRGGRYAVEEVIRSKAVNTIRLNSDFEVSGTFLSAEFDSTSREQLELICIQGPVQWTFNGKSLCVNRDETFQCVIPLGSVESCEMRNGSLIDSAKVNLNIGEAIEIKYSSGCRARGRVQSVERNVENACVAIEMLDFELQNEQGKSISACASMWLPFGTSVVEGYSGPSVRESFGEYSMGVASSSPARQLPFTLREQAMFKLYDWVNTKLSMPVGQVSELDIRELDHKCSVVLDNYAGEWLLMFEFWYLAKVWQKYKNHPLLLSRMGELKPHLADLMH